MNSVQNEECDDGNIVNGDGCSSTCQLETGYSCTSTSCSKIPCTSSGYTGNAGACSCASGFTGTVSYSGGAPRGCVAVGCSSTGYAGNAGACNCASGYSGSVIYTKGVLGGCNCKDSFTIKLHVLLLLHVFVLVVHHPSNMHVCCSRAYWACFGIVLLSDNNVLLDPRSRR